MKNKWIVALAATLMASALPSFATEATDNALFKGTNPLGEALGKPIYANRVFQHGYHCWDPSVIKVGDTYHLFYSRWKMVEGQVNNLAHWMTTSEIVHATSSKLLGPYINVENPAISAKENHDWWLHNPKITTEYNKDGSIKRYVLYFINVRKGAIAGTSWLYSDDPKKRWGDPLPNNRGSINQLPGDTDHEDACIWEVNGQYHALMTDMSGRATGGKKKAVMHWFTDAKSGTNYRLYSDVSLGYVHDSVTFAEGNTERYYRMERPNVFVNPDTKKVEAFLLSCVPSEESQSVPTEGASIIIWPVNGWSPETK